MKRIVLAFVVLGPVIGAADRCRAGLVLESATLGATGQTGGYSVSDVTFLGARFDLDDTYRIEQVGAHLSGYGSLFAAIVSLPGPSSFPGFAPNLIESSALAATTFDASSLSEDLLTPLDVTLGPGSYALIIGSGAFGADGSGSMPFNNTPTSQASFFGGLLYTNPNRWLNSGSGLRFVVTGELAPTVAAPEPTTLIGGLLGIALAGGGWWLRSAVGRGSVTTIPDLGPRAAGDPVE